MEAITFKIYQKIGEYFTGSDRKKPFYIWLLAAFIFLNFLSYCLKIVVDIETLHWVFSSLVQALLALVALMGVVSIFRLQNLHNDESRILDESNDPMRGYFSLLNNRYSTIEKLNSAIETYLSSHQGNDTNLILIVTMHRRIDNLRTSQRLVIDYAVKYTVYTFAVALLALLFLIVSSQISVFYLGIGSLCLMFILASYSLFLATKGFAYSIGD